MYDDQNNTYRYSRGDESLPRDDYQPQTNTYNEAPRYEEPVHSNYQAQSAYQQLKRQQAEMMDELNRLKMLLMGLGQEKDGLERDIQRLIITERQLFK